MTFKNFEIFCCLLSTLKHSGSFRFEQYLPSLMDFVCFEGPLRHLLEPHAVADEVSSSIEAAVVVPGKWPVSLCFCRYSTDRLLGFDFVLSTPRLWPLIFALLQPCRPV